MHLDFECPNPLQIEHPICACSAKSDSSLIEPCWKSSCPSLQSAINYRGLLGTPIVDFETDDKVMNLLDTLIIIDETSDTV